MDRRPRVPDWYRRLAYWLISHNLCPCRVGWPALCDALRLERAMYR